MNIFNYSNAMRSCVCVCVCLCLPAAIVTVYMRSSHMRSVIMLRKDATVISQLKARRRI